MPWKLRQFIGLGGVRSAATVDPNNAIFEADETNNTDTESTLVSTGIDLTILKTDVAPGFDPIATSGTQTYTITVDNLGPQDATNIRVRDTLPANTRFRSVVGDNGFSCSHSNGVVECVGGSILGTAAEFYLPPAPGNDTATIVIRVFAQPNVGTGVDGMHNEARVDPDNAIAEINEANNIDFEDTNVVSGNGDQGAFNQLTIAKTQVSPANPVARNAVVTYNLAIGNAGTDPAVGVTVRDFLPAGARYISATGQSFICSELAAFVQCVGGQIQAGATVNITVKAFAPDTPGTYTNQGVVDPDNSIPEGNEFDNESSVQTVVQNAGNGPFNELSIVKTQVSPANPVARNALVTYSIVVSNTGSDGVINVKVRDFLPAGSSYIEATGTNQFLCTELASFVDCVGGQIAGGGNATITMTVFAPDTPGTYTNQALVDPEDTIPEGDEQNNDSSVQTVVENGGNGPFNDLTINKTGTGNTTPGGAISYTLQVANIGSNPAANVTVRDILPAGTTFVSAEDSAPAAPGAFTCSHAAGVVNCVGGTLPGGGAPRLIAIEVTAPNTTVVLTNQALIDPDNAIAEGNELNNTDTADTTVASVINLKITKTGPNTSSQSTTSDYVIKVKNEPPSGGGGGQTAFGVKMHDPLPVGLIPLAVNAGSGNNWACQIAENPINVVDCLGDLNPDQEVTVTITVFMTAESGRSLDNEACVDPDDTIEEYTPPGNGDNCSTHSTAVGPPAKRSPDLLVNKGASEATTTPGAALQYTITLSNIGTADAVTPLSLTDNLPADVTFVGATATNGWNCTEALGTITCDDAGAGLATGASTQVTVDVTVSNTANLPIANTAVAAPALADLTEGDTEHETAANIANNSSTVVTSVGGSAFDLAIASITDNPDPVNRAAQVVYTIAAVNGGTGAANGVHVAVAIPPTGVTLMGAAGSNGFNCAAPVADVIDCVGDLPGGGDTVITVTFAVLLGAPDDLNLTATIDPGDLFAETTEGNNSQTEVTTVSGDTCTASPCVDLVAAQLVESSDPVQPGAALTYDYALVNVGDSSTALDPTPVTGEPLTFFDILGNFAVGTITSSNPAVTCVVNGASSPGSSLLLDCFGNLGGGQGTVITVNLTAGLAGSITATGNADPGLDVDEFLETNNTISVTTTVAP